MPDGEILAATRMGVQICNGSLTRGIVPVPGGGATESVVLGGAAFDTLYVVAGDKIYARKTNLHGMPPPKS
jgi:hypothetical protein